MIITVSALVLLVLLAASERPDESLPTVVEDVFTRMAQEACADARLVVLEGSGHGFHGAARDRVKEEMAAFVRPLSAASP